MAGVIFTCKLAVFTAFGLLGLASAARGDVDAGTIQRPVHSAAVFRITDYGAVAGDKSAKSMGALQGAVDACLKAGGGIVEVPEGRFFAYPFRLGSGIDLKLDAGAALAMDDDPADYVGKTDGCITAKGCHDIEISGSGTIDGQGGSWWPRYKKGMPPAPHRPYMVLLSDCARVLVQGVTLENSPSFHLVPDSCTDVTIDGVHIQAPSDAPNTDGCDPSGWNFLIRNCSFDVGDDCIAVKPSRVQADGRPSCENFTIEDCTFLHGHGMSIGGQSRGGLDGMLVRDCTFDGTQAGIRMKAPRGAGGLVQNVTYDHLTMTNVKVPILITSYYPRIPKDPAADPAQGVTSLTPIWRNIRISDVTSTGSPSAGQIIGLPEMPVSGITLTNVAISADRGLQVVNARGIQFIGSKIQVRSGRALEAQDAEVTGL